MSEIEEELERFEELSKSILAKQSEVRSIVSEYEELVKEFKDACMIIEPKMSNWREERVKKWGDVLDRIRIKWSNPMNVVNNDPALRSEYDAFCAVNRIVLKRVEERDRYRERVEELRRC